MIRITRAIALDDNEIEHHFIRAGGPGGQKVNKVATAVQLRFDVAHSPSLPDDVRRRIKALAGRRMTADGILVIDARRHRTQESNRRDALGRLVDLIRRAAVRPHPRGKTQPSKAAVKRRLAAKHHRGETKRRRAPVTDPES